MAPLPVRCSCVMTDHWDFYFCEVDHRVASIFVDLGIVEEVPMADHSRGEMPSVSSRVGSKPAATSGLMSSK